MNRTTIGWLFVAVQAVLLATIVLLPAADLWPTPQWFDGATLAAIVAGLVVVSAAALGLGPALTASPVPAQQGRLTTSGLYRWVRHPIYSGVLLIVIGLAARSGNGITAALTAVAVGFFNIKAAWEESQLARRYPDYQAYAEKTPRFVPHFTRSRRRA